MLKLREVNGRGQIRVVWLADSLPNEVDRAIRLMVEQGMTVIIATLDRLVRKELADVATAVGPLPTRLRVPCRAQPGS